MAKKRRASKDRGAAVFFAVVLGLLIIMVILLWVVIARRGVDRTLDGAAAAPAYTATAEVSATPAATPVISETEQDVLAPELVDASAASTSSVSGVGGVSAGAVAAIKQTVETAQPDLPAENSPTSAPTPGAGARVIDTVSEGALPERDGIKVKTIVYQGDQRKDGTYARAQSVSFGDAQTYTRMEGITTFRGNNYRDCASYGTIPENPSALEYAWSVKIGQLDDWGGVGWTGQCSIVRWPEETRKIMNLYPEKKAKEDLVEVIYATLDGNIYFLDLEDGTPTRDKISIGAPIKGSLSVDPRGYPLLYCGQGIDEVKGKSVKIGTRIFSLIDGSVLYFLDGRDDKAIRKWYAFDAAPLVDAETDTLLQVGENGIFYVIALHTQYDSQAGTVSVSPEIDRYVYTSIVSERPGMENSVAVYNHYAYFVDNSGLIQCVDINSLACLWAQAAGDDTDATVVLEEEKEIVALYTACEVDRRTPSSGASVQRDVYLRKVNALTGDLVWGVAIECSGSKDSNGGAFATPAVGKGELGDLVFFHLARTSDGGTIYALDKETGEIIWQRNLKYYGWSSPVCVYTPNGKGYVLVGSGSGQLRILRGLTGDLIADADLGANIEGSPVVFEDMLVVGTRGRRIYGVRIIGGAA